MAALFKPLDPRITAELRKQKRTIWLGLVCVALCALLAAAMIPMTEMAIRAIIDSTPTRVDDRQRQSGASELAKEFGIPDSRANQIVASANPIASQVPDASLLAKELGVSLERATEGRARVIESLTPQSDDSPAKRQEEALVRLAFVCIAVVGLFILKYFFTLGQVFFLSQAANRLGSDLRVRLYDKLQRLPIGFFHSKRIGSLQSVLTNDVNVFQNAVSIVRDSIDGPFKAVAALVTIFFISWPLALVALLFVPIIAYFVYRNGQKMKRDQAQVQEDLADLSGITQEALNGVRVVKAFAAEERMGGLYNSQVESTFSSQTRANRRFAKLRPMVELIGAVSLAVILLICGFMAQRGLLQVSQIVALTFALDVINQGLRAIGNVNNTYNQVQAAAERIYGEILDRPDETLSSGVRKLENPRGRIIFEEVSFTYSDGTKALDSISFTLEPGQSLALVGPSGAGKSTIADLILRFYDPTEGRITFDGVDIRELDLAWLRQQFGVVPQQTFLFAGTIAENIRLGQPKASDEEIRKAADLANASGFITSDPQGFEAVLGEKGARISGGEGQRIAIARALVRQPTVLLLDEATSNLDAESEKLVTEALQLVMAQRTTLFIAHRLTTAARADTILVLRRGRVLEQGSHDELLGQQGAYASMFKAFTSGMSDGILAPGS
ncbi:MAG: ABC transporter ATP-binding protein/permease [Fimbriimonadaceae bacterium]|jgi:subfamily B ATP-binding cassette protein MsbA|nr:ABC transporter ATP-binding protein/permease [Fimbriimonadaceae bacterium]